MQSTGLKKLAALGFFVLAPACGPKALPAFITGLGYTEVRPPSAGLYEPGAIVGWTPGSDGKLGSIKVVCTKSASVGSGELATEAASADWTINKLSKQDLEFGIQYLKLIDAKSTYTGLQSVSLTFDQTKVKNLAISSAVAGMNNRSVDCKNAIAQQKAAGVKLSMVTEVLEASVKYKVKHSFGQDRNAVLNLLETLKTTLKASGSNVDEESLTGTALYWGMKDDTSIVEPVSPNHVTMAAVRMIPATSVTIDPSPPLAQ